MAVLLFGVDVVVQAFVATLQRYNKTCHIYFINFYYIRSKKCFFSLKENDSELQELMKSFLYCPIIARSKGALRWNATLATLAAFLVFCVPVPH